MSLPKARTFVVAGLAAGALTLLAAPVAGAVGARPDSFSPPKPRAGSGFRGQVQRRTLGS